jgi:hypothetical protein
MTQVVVSVANRRARLSWRESARRAGSAASWAQPNLKLIQIFFPRVQFVKWQNCPSQTPQITKIIWGGIINKKEQHSFWAQIQIPKGF